MNIVNIVNNRQKQAKVILKARHEMWVKSSHQVCLPAEGQVASQKVNIFRGCLNLRDNLTERKSSPKSEHLFWSIENPVPVYAGVEFPRGLLHDFSNIV